MHIQVYGYFSADSGRAAFTIAPHENMLHLADYSWVHSVSDKDNLQCCIFCSAFNQSVKTTYLLVLLLIVTGVKQFVGFVLLKVYANYCNYHLI